jgi:hypothetical protein
LARWSGAVYPAGMTLKLAAETIRQLATATAVEPAVEPAEKRTAKCRPSYGKC